MNYERFGALVEWLERGGDAQMGFYMNSWSDHYEAEDYLGRTCETSCCMGGFVEHTFDPTRSIRSNFTSGINNIDKDVAIGAKLLDISKADAEALFYPDLEEVPALKDGYEDVIPEQALEVVMNYLETGKVDWNLPFME